MEDGALRNRFQFHNMFPIGLPTEAKENIVVIPASPQQITDAFPAVCLANERMNRM